VNPLSKSCFVTIVLVGHDVWCVYLQYFFISLENFRVKPWVVEDGILHDECSVDRGGCVVGALRVATVCILGDVAAGVNGGSKVLPWWLVGCTLIWVSYYGCGQLCIVRNIFYILLQR